MRTSTTVLVIAVVSVCVSTAQALEMDWVAVGDPGNMADTRYDWCGSVACVYNIGKYEVTNNQYVEFLNAVASSDANELYSENMGSGYGGITRSGSAGNYTYSAILGRGNMPVIFVSWFDTLRFANWMHNGQPTGAQDPLTTEDGAYDMSLGSTVVRKPGAQVFLPSEHQWYKAAYYKGGSTDAGYWDFATQSDTPPTAEGPAGTDMIYGSANHGFVVGDLTSVGAYSAKPSDSAYGTFDQGGNVFEWNELDFGPYRGMRGGSFYYTDLSGISLHAVARFLGEPSMGDCHLGFRLASEVPEPATLILSTFGGLAVLRRRR